MLGFGRKPKPGQEKNEPAETGESGPAKTGAAPDRPPQVPLKLREPGSKLTPDQSQSEIPTDSKPPFRAPKKTKLHLMTGREENERAFQAAREHYLSKNLPSIHKETRRKERSRAFEFLMDRLVAVVGFFLIVVGWMWLYNHGAEIETWWKSLLESIKLI
jgi:hypothetical protein